MTNTAHPYHSTNATNLEQVVAMGTSAGGMKALQTLLAALPKTFPWPILLVQHLHPEHQTYLPAILSRSCALTVKLAEADDRLERGTVYVAPPDHHMSLTPDYKLALNKEPAVHFSRPAIDILFKSVAQVCGKQAIAIILTGSNTDGADGIRAIKAQGGMTLAQLPAEAQSPRMPRAAIQTGCVDRVLQLEAIAEQLFQLTQTI